MTTTLEDPAAAATDAVQVENGDQGKGKKKNKAVEKAGVVSSETTVLEMIPLDKIDASPLNRPLSSGDDNVADLAASIEERGLLQPIAVRPLPDTDRYEIIFGHRRVQACRQLGHMFIRAQVRNVDEKTAHADRLIENMSRRDLTHMEEGLGVRSLLDLHYNNVAEVAARLGQTENWVRRRAKLPNLSEKWQAILADTSPENEYAHIRDSLQRAEEIALLPVESQDELLERGALRWNRSKRDFRRALAKQLRQLDTRPWLEDGKEVGLTDFSKCTKCSKRSDQEGDLFACLTEDEENATAFCLDQVCWNEKVDLWILRQLKVTPDAVAIVDYHTNQKELRTLELKYNVRVFARFEWEEVEDESEEDDENEPLPEGYEERQGVVVAGDRLGQVITVQVDMSEPEPEPEQDEEEQEDPEVVAQRRKEEAEKRKKEEEAKKRRDAENKRFQKELKARLPDECPLTDATDLLRLSYWVGFHGNSGTGLKKIIDDGDFIARVWKKVRVNLIDMAGYTYQPISDKDKAALCELLGLDWSEVKAVVKGKK